MFAVNSFNCYNINEETERTRMGNEVTKELIQWHAAFRGAIKTELADESDILKYEDERTIVKKELKIDLLIIKKTNEKQISNHIGHIFREYNIFEYKSPGDYLSQMTFIRSMRMPVFINRMQTGQMQ